MAHPLAADIETITSALAAGMADQPGSIPEHLKINYEDPLADGADGVATLRFADWRSENHGVLYVPMIIDSGNTAWQAYCEDGIAQVAARLVVQDMLGRGFTYTASGEKKITSYLQFDILDEGIVFSARPQGEEAVMRYGGFEGETYDILSAYAKRVSSFTAILELANQY